MLWARPRHDPAGVVPGRALIISIVRLVPADR
jgi:hypothetical protein